MTALRVATAGGERWWISLSELSASTLAVEWTGVALRIFCDGSGGDGVITLGSVAADVALWCSVEVEWVKALADLGIEEWHTKDAVGRSQGSEFAGWSDATLAAAIDRLCQALWPFRRSNLVAYACCVPIDEYDRYRIDHPDFIKEPEAICVNVCVAGVDHIEVPMDGDRTIPFIGVFFDEGERFMHTMHRVWQDQRRRVGGWAHQVLQVSAVNSRYTPAIQIADLVAWGAHRAHTAKPVAGPIDADVLNYELSLFIKYRETVCDYAKIEELERALVRP